MVKKLIALVLTLGVVVSLCSCSLSELFGGAEEESTTDWTMLSTTEPYTDWSEDFSLEDLTDVSGEPHDCATQGHLWKAATCYAPKTCAACGLTEGVKLEHSFKEATCTSPQRCRYCGATVGSALGHTWGSDGKCTRCGQSKTAVKSNGSDTCDHQWIDATCTTPRTCAKCGKVSGEPNKHNYAAATCTTPQKCRNCGATVGSPKGHDYDSRGYCTRCHLNRAGVKDPSYNPKEATATAKQPETEAPPETKPTETKPTETKPTETKPTSPESPYEPDATTTTTQEPTTTTTTAAPAPVTDEFARSSL